MSRRRSRETPRWYWYLIGLALTAAYVLPMAYVLLAAVTPTGQAIGKVPDGLAWSNFVDAFAQQEFGRFAINSIVVAVVSTVVQVALAMTAGYALAKLPVPGARSHLVLLIALLVVPPEIIMVPLFVLAARLPLVGGNDILGQGGQGLVDSLPGLVIPHLISALAIFLMRQFYKDLPDELADAARVDGAGELAIFWRIYTPLVLPAVAVVAIFALQSAWNDFLWPLVMTRSVEQRTLQLGLTSFFQEHSTQWNYLMAVVLVISIPVVALFLWAQRWFRGDVMSGAVK
ncbi:binding-protein-dependent transport systems inner membrane component [Beutenbergia cavernae DSM 12333]|uniref:Binding-protein-dependent transport systems inner membrane component n=1 Tax=Beutenbergia cavernae (strain ATCC BAA-8 / DSM 12333 / CCUG 43141 / JCM 11478 / NBRC 16432 / NCIMB 13614 / HKI 0122) TaxID=471853 RepID=C5C585_BEUC1|nr:carbohydrate ABC transporter permease [Beutenbergia cavernae]ACQ82225.1 binding-protein-dependent transport systems inner membrane component [Beutenbergia cavernae DSM 12333]